MAYKHSIWDKNCPILDACGIHYMDNSGHSIKGDSICENCPRALVGLPCVLETCELIRPAHYKEVRERNGIIKSRAYIKH